MKQRTTLRDIAQATGISVVSVHKALQGKSGVSEQTRHRVCEVAAAMHYSANEAASALGRGTRTIAVILPHETQPDGYFYRDMWRALHDAQAALADFNVRVTPIPCSPTPDGQTAALEEVAAHDSVDGVVVVNSFDRAGMNKAISRLWEHGVPVVTVNSDAAGSKRLCCVSASNERAGQLAAEFMASGMPDGPLQVLLLGDNPAADIHRANADGFLQRMHLLRPDAKITQITDPGDGSTVAQTRIYAALQAAPQLYGAYAVSARDTVRMCRAAEALHAHACLVGSDVFRELAPFFARGTLRATIWKDPYEQMRRALNVLTGWFAGRPASCDTVRIGLVMSGNLADYLPPAPASAS